MEQTSTSANYREEDPGKERRRLKLIKRLKLKGKSYYLPVLESLKKSKRGKLEEDGGWQEILVNGEYMLEISNPEHVDIKMDWDEFMRLNTPSFEFDTSKITPVVQHEMLKKNLEVNWDLIKKEIREGTLESISREVDHDDWKKDTDNLSDWDSMK